MTLARWLRRAAGRPLIQSWPWLLGLLALLLVRLSRGALVTDVYAQITRPFWPGTAQAEWLRSARRFEDQARLAGLEVENRRLRGLLGLPLPAGRGLTAPVISRQPSGWWHLLVLGKGSLAGLAPGQPVLAPGGLIGRLSSVTPSTATVTLLTDPTSRLGVWVPRTQSQGLLTGIGTSRPLLRFIDKDPQVRPGDLVTTSPASTLLPANLPVGVIRAVDAAADPAPEAVVQLGAPAASVDWVQVLGR
ncbi:MAG: rod shape-determining protein MreC [Synechococcaceae cyanobacterium]|nr:rod shape-determining protein MreC [Synechococcaceae cyanobacterium]